MEIRLLKYFLTVAREQNITKAAEILHITQPTLSRQLSGMEEELGVQLFVRSNRKMTLTAEGILLKRRALEILELEEKTLQEIKKQDELVEGCVSIGCGESKAVEQLANICKSYKEKYPLVQIRLHTATADVVSEQMNQGLLDIGLFIEPVNIENFDYVRLPGKEYWTVGMRADDPLAKQEVIRKADLLDKPVILPERMNMQSELANWFGADYQKLQVAFVSNLATNAAIMAQNGMGYPISIEGVTPYWKENLIVRRRLSPALYSTSVLAWRRNIPYAPAVQRFIEEIQACCGSQQC